MCTQRSRQADASGHPGDRFATRNFDLRDTYMYITWPQEVLDGKVSGGFEVSNASASNETSELEHPLTNRSLARRLLEAWSRSHVALTWSSPISAAMGFEIWKLQLCRGTPDRNLNANHSGLLAFLLQEAGMDIMDGLKSPAGYMIDTPMCTLSSHVQEIGQGDAAYPESRTDDRTPVSNNPLTDSSRHEPLTPDVSDMPMEASPSQRNALERRMEEIFADWGRCQEGGISDSDSEDYFDTNAGSPSDSDASNGYEYSGNMCFIRHGDAPSSGAPASLAMGGIGGGYGSRVGRNSLSGRSTQSLQEIEDGGSMDSGECLIADDQEYPKEEGAKVMICPMKDCTGKDCTGKDSVMSELL
jgi:hypothetical protein